MHGHPRRPRAIRILPGGDERRNTCQWQLGRHSTTLEGRPAVAPHASTSGCGATQHGTCTLPLVLTAAYVAGCRPLCGRSPRAHQPCVLPCCASGRNPGHGVLGPHDPSVEGRAVQGHPRRSATPTRGRVPGRSANDLPGTEGNDLVLECPTHPHMFAWPTGHSGYVRCLAVLHNGTLVSGSEDHTIRLWSADGQCSATLTGHTDDVACMVVLPDGTLASGSDDSTIRLWRHGSCTATLCGHRRDIYSMVVMTDGTLASASKDCTVRLWRDGQPVATLEDHRCRAASCPNPSANPSASPSPLSRHTPRTTGKRVAHCPTLLRTYSRVMCATPQVQCVQPRSAA